MKKTVLLAFSSFVALLLVNTVSVAAPVVFPKNGQSQEQQNKDEAECHVWAVNRTGFDPSYATTPQVAPQAAEGGAVRGAARGALLGAAIGSFSADAGKGAAIGAAAGGIGGHYRRNDQRRRMSAEQQALQAEQDRKRDEYQRARTACLEGKGYTVR